MEGWDGTTDGRPTDLVRRRWRRFGQSGAALVWGGEAVAVPPDGRANPHQLGIGPSSVGDLAALRHELLAGHRATAPATRAAHRAAADALRSLVAPRRHAGARRSRSGTRCSTPRSARPTRTSSPTPGSTTSSARTRRRPSWPARPGSTSWTSSTATATCCTSCSARASGRAGTAATSPAAPGSSTETVAAIRRDAPGAARSGCASRPSTSSRTSAAPTVAAYRRPTGPYPYAFGGDGTGLGVDLDRGARAVRAARRARRVAALRHRGQPVLLPARPAARVLPAVGRLPAAARSAARGRAAARRHRRDHPCAPGAHRRRERAVVPPGVDARGRGRHRRPRRRGSRRVRARRPLVPASCRPTCSRARTWSGRGCAARSRTARPRRGTASSRVATRSIPFYKARPERLELTAAKRAPGECLTWRRPKIALAMLDGLVGARVHARAAGPARRGRRDRRPGAARRRSTRTAPRRCSARPRCWSATGAAPRSPPRWSRSRPRLRLFAYAAGTVKWQVTDAVWDHGIVVTSAAAANAVPVAEYTVAMVLLANKGVLLFREWLRDPAVQVPLDPSTVGQLPAPGRSRRRVAGRPAGDRAARAVRPRGRGLRPVPHARTRRRGSGVEKVDDLDALCASVDVLSLHAPDVEATRGMIGARAARRAARRRDVPQHRPSRARRLRRARSRAHVRSHRRDPRRRRAGPAPGRPPAARAAQRVRHPARRRRDGQRAAPARRARGRRGGALRRAASRRCTRCAARTWTASRERARSRVCAR